MPRKKSLQKLSKKQNTKFFTKGLFVQDAGIFGDEFFVAIDLTYEEIVKAAKKLGAVSLFFENMKDAKENYWKDRMGEDAGFVLIDEHQHAFLMYFQKVEDAWGFWEKVLHECVHVVQALERSKMLSKEDECRAYTTEYLFRGIRRKLMGIDKCESVKL